VAKIENVGCCPKLNPVAIFRSRQVHASFNIDELEPVEREKGEQPSAPGYSGPCDEKSFDNK
jgi:hypothetical protein